MKGRKANRWIGMKMIVILNFITNEVQELLDQVCHENISKSLTSAIEDCSNLFSTLENGVARKDRKLSEYEDVENEILDIGNGRHEEFNRSLELLETIGELLLNVPSEKIVGMQMAQLSKYAKGSLIS